MSRLREIILVRVMLRKNLRKLFCKHKNFKQMSLIENSKFGEVVNAAHGYMLEKIRHGDLINNDLKHQYFQSQTKQNITKSNFSINREVNGQRIHI